MAFLVVGGIDHRVPVYPASLRKKLAGTYDAAKTWFDGEVAKSIVKKIVTARAEGYAGIQIGNTEDWYSDTLGGLREVTFNLIGADAMSGLIEVTPPPRRSPDFRCVKTPGAPEKIGV